MKTIEVVVSTRLPKDLHKQYTEYCDKKGIKHKKFIEQSIKEKLQKEIRKEEKGLYV